MDAIRKQAQKFRESRSLDNSRFNYLSYLRSTYFSGSSGKNHTGICIINVFDIQFYLHATSEVEIGTKLSKDSRKYGVENTCTSGNALSKAAMSYSSARMDIEREREHLLKALGTQVAEPLRAMVVGAPLEDARRHAQRYDKVRQEAESQPVKGLWIPLYEHQMRRISHAQTC